jgi:DNA-binding MarR family transcriptional regulator
MRLEEALKTTNFANETHKATLNLVYTTYWLRSHFVTAMKDHGITMEQFNVLRILKGKHPQQMCVKDIGSRMIEKSSNVPRIIDKLILKDLVERGQSAEDKRETLVTLTDKGIALLLAANKSLDESTKGIVGIDEADAAQLNILLEKMRKVD